MAAKTVCTTCNHMHKMASGSARCTKNGGTKSIKGKRRSCPNWTRKIRKGESIVDYWDDVWPNWRKE